MSWWAPHGPSAQARGHFLDEMEYFAAKNLGLDSAMSIQGVNVSQQPLSFHIEKQFTVLGWHEQLRLARYFDTGTIARVAVPGDEFRLRQDLCGAWQFTPVKMSAHRPCDGGCERIRGQWGWLDYRSLRRNRGYHLKAWATRPPVSRSTPLSRHILMISGLLLQRTSDKWIEFGSVSTKQGVLTSVRPTPGSSKTSRSPP